MSVRQVTDDNFKEHVAAQGVTFVDFGAPWCPPCKVLLPIMDELDKETGGALTVLKVNCDESPRTASEFGVMSMPTVILFKDGQPMEKWVGLRPKEVYRAGIAKYLS